MKEELGGLTQEGYKANILQRLRVGHTCKLWEIAHSDEVFHARERIKVQREHTAAGFYPHIVHFTGARGASVCYSYEEAYKALEGDA